MILYLTAGLFGGYNETIKFEELGISTHSLTRRLTTSGWLAAFCSLFQLTASQGGWQGRYRSIQTNMVFQLTASQGGWLPLIPFWISLRAISTHSLTRRLTNTKQKYRWTSSFQLTASQGGWLRRIRESCVKGYFNSQPHKEADHKCVWLCNWLEYFNSQPHKEADNFHQFFQLIPEISTHSLTRRLTISRQGNYHMYIFQLTASQGGWLIYIYIKAILGLFQLTASQGGWRLTRYCAVLHDFYFNSQPHKEADSVSIQCIFRHGNFNSQPHKEADTSFRFLYTFASFQLTASQGGWPASGPMIWWSKHISTHSLTRRLTRSYPLAYLRISYFNSQPHKEADGNMPYYEMDMTVFQLTASQGGWLIQPVWYTMNLHFNSQPHKEADFRGPRIRISSI